MYFKSKKRYEAAKGKRFNPSGYPSIHVSGSVKGMVNLGFWRKNADRVRVGSWIYSIER